ncbi:MAG: class I SAM-dependent methyltransferase [Actinobacteria bacterium]|nr:class I SAM-dependent methyltransferase [Actinomycetota bacterium]
MTANSYANQEQAEFWGGARGRSWADATDRYDAQLERYALLAVSAAAPLPGDTVLDIGCGTGATTFECAAAVGPTGHVIGVDISRPMLERAEANRASRKVTNVRFLEADAQVMPPLERLVDAVVSRFGVMFFADPTAAFANIASMTRDRGRLGFVCWGPVSENEWMIIPALAIEPVLPLPPATAPDAPGPFAFGDQDRVERILLDAGWDEITFEKVNDPLYLGGPGSLDEVVAFVLGSSSVALQLGDRRVEAAELLRKALAPRHDGVGVKFHANAHVVRAVRR